MSKLYRQHPVTVRELESLLALAIGDEERFFREHDNCVVPYRNRLLCIALCQGAALQFLGQGYGVADFDVHFFYAKNPDKPRLSRAVKRTIADVGGFAAIPVDYVRTVVPGATLTGDTRSTVEQLQAFLQQRPTANAFHLAQKAVVGLSPSPLFGRVLWPPL